jgi:hypothetical protein
MFERSVPIIRMICIGLAALIIVQVTRLAAQKDPLRDVKIPVLASALSVSSNSLTSTNSLSGSNSLASSNSLSRSNSLTSSNVVASSNRPAISNSLASSNVLTGSNTLTKSATSTNEPGTNSLAQGSGKIAATNSPPGRGSTAGRASTTPRPIPGGMRGGPGGPGAAMPALPPAIQTRVDKITQSEILGPVVRPQPMALQAIGGRDALLRSPMGQTGWLREGEELGGVKLLRIGTNRVLIEHEGQKKELMIFSGFGSETLLPKGNQSPQ